MKNKKIVLTVIIIIALLLIGGLSYYFLTKEDKNTTLNLFEKQWIENNKNNIIDMSIVNQIPILSYNGEGIIIDFLDSLNKNTNLSFNKISYSLGEEVKTDYSFKLVDEVLEDNILIYEDNYIVVTKKDTYLSIDDLNGLEIGVLNENLNNVNIYLHNANVSYKTFNTKDELVNEFLKEDTSLNAIILLKTTDLKLLFDNNFKIAYNISDYKKYFVLDLGSTERLNTILTKYYSKWASENYLDSYNKYLSNNYFKFKNINDSEIVKFRSKRYVYGFIENAPYDTLLDNKLAGINYQLLSNFSKLTKAEISYKNYNNISSLVNAFNSNEIDLFYGINNTSDYSLDVYNTIPVYNNTAIVLKHSSNDLIINSIKSLDNVVSIENSYMSEYLTNNNITVTAYSNMEDLINNLTDDSIVVLDTLSYNYYSDKLKEFIISYQFDCQDNSFISRNISDNRIFNEFFDFYIRFNDNLKFVNSGLSELLLINKTPIILKNLAVIIGSVFGILLVILFIVKIKPKKNKVILTKEDKLRYIDNLTSLKNRNYLNDSIERWDNTDVYPQAIIIVDLNNIAYINDNYGHVEGDEVIRQAANILILNQIENSEIIRTNGNEFLIYLIGHEEKQVITYMRKLGKELKDLKHGFGCAMGYSMINDAIKTIDDAINEATLDMKSNKEESRN